MSHRHLETTTTTGHNHHAVVVHHRSSNHHFQFNDTRNNQTILGGDFTDLDKISTSREIADAETIRQADNEDDDETTTQTCGIVDGGCGELVSTTNNNKDVTIPPLSECTIYDNKDTPGDDGELITIGGETSESRVVTTMATNNNNNKNNNVTTTNTNNQTIVTIDKPLVKPIDEVINFDNLSKNNDTHFDRRMLKLIEGKMQATRSATSFSNSINHFNN